MLRRAQIDHRQPVHVRGQQKHGAPPIGRPHKRMQPIPVVIVLQATSTADHRVEDVVRTAV